MRKHVTLFSALIALAGAVIIYTHQVPTLAVLSGSNEHRVTRVVDGDTFEVIENGKPEKVRMIGMDTPETVDPRRPVQCFGKEASAQLKKLLTDQHVRLESDPTNQDRDKYQRLLRYVYLDDGTDVNAKMISDGYAFAYIQFPFERRDEFVRLQAEARAAKRGLWSPDTCNGIHK